MHNITNRAAAVLFDMDGVLIDSNEVIERAWRETADMYGKTISEDEIIKHIHGQPVHILFGHCSVTYRSWISKKFRLILFMSKTRLPTTLFPVSLSLSLRWMQQASGLVL